MQPEIAALLERDDIQELKDTLKSYPGVHTVGVSYRQEDGEWTHEPVLYVSVEDKKTEDELEDEDIVPKTIAGIRTDVREASHPEFQINGKRAQARHEDNRPLAGGQQITADSLDTWGSLGMCVIDRDGDPALLSNHHILGAGTDTCDPDNSDLIGDSVYITDEESSETKIGEVSQLSDRNKTFQHYDWGIAKLDDGVEYTNHILGVGELSRIKYPNLGDWCIVTGARSGLMGAEVSGTSVDIELDEDCWYRNLFEYDQDHDGDESAGGNSGSVTVWVDDETGNVHPFALNFAGSTTGTTATYGYGAPLKIIRDRVGFTLPNTTTEPDITEGNTTELEAARQTTAVFSTSSLSAQPCRVHATNLGTDTGPGDVTLDGDSYEDEREVTLDSGEHDRLWFHGEGDEESHDWALDVWTEDASYASPWDLGSGIFSDGTTTIDPQPATATHSTGGEPVSRSRTSGSSTIEQ